MRLHGRFAVSRCRAGLSVDFETMGTATQCFCYRICSVSSFFTEGDIIFIPNVFLNSLEAAAASPETLSQAAIIDNLDPVEAARLDKVRNIGIAVRITLNIYAIFERI